MVESKYNLIATVNHKPSKKNDGHNTAVNKSPASKSWYKYDKDIINLVKFVKRNTNSMLMDFQKTASILFYVHIKYVSVCQHNLCNDDKVIEIMGHDRPPVIDQLQDATLPLFLSNTSSLSSSYILSLSLSNNSSRSMASARSKTNLDDIVSFCLHLNRWKIAGATQLTLNLPILFYPFAIGLWIWCQKVSTIPHIKNSV